MLLLLLFAAALAHASSSSSSSPPQPHPAVPPALLSRILFLETFQGEDDPIASSRWQLSQEKAYAGQQWSWHEGSKMYFADDKGLMLNKAHAHYGMSKIFADPIEIGEGDFVLQYEVKSTGEETGRGAPYTCGGAYVKLLTYAVDFSPKRLEEKTPYVIMFGPDKCGSTNKVHLIFRELNPSNKRWEEKHLTKAISGKFGVDGVTHLYTLVVRGKTNTYSVLVDEVEVASGSFLDADQFTPSFGAPKEIVDPNDVKPADWVDAAKIVDPNAVKPADWDEDAPETIPDPDAKKPEAWDDEDDGEWAAPRIPNPDFKGKWVAPQIDNPGYKGEWKARKIPNPNYFVEERPVASLAKIGALAVEILSNDRGIVFDNFLISRDVDAAKEFAALTFTPKHAFELEQSVRAAKEARQKALLDMWEGEGVLSKLQYIAGVTTDFVNGNLVAVIASAVAGVCAFAYWLCFTGGGEFDPQRGPMEGGAGGEDEASDSGAEEDDSALLPPSVGGGAGKPPVPPSTSAKPLVSAAAAPTTPSNTPNPTPAPTPAKVDHAKVGKAT